MCARGRMCAQCLHDPGAAGIARSIIKFAEKKTPLLATSVIIIIIGRLFDFFCILQQNCIPFLGF